MLGLFTVVRMRLRDVLDFGLNILLARYIILMYCIGK